MWCTRFHSFHASTPYWLEHLDEPSSEKGGADSGGGGASGYSNGTVTITSAQQGGNNSSFAFAQIRLLT